MTLLHQAAQKAVEALKHPEGDWSLSAALAVMNEVRYQLESALQHQEVPREPVADFDTWQQNPYTKVLLDSIKNDYMPRADAEALIRAAASPSTTRQQEVGSKKPLTLEQIIDATEHIDMERPGVFVTVARAVERAHGIGRAAAPSTPEKAGGVSDGVGQR